MPGLLPINLLPNQTGQGKEAASLHKESMTTSTSKSGKNKKHQQMTIIIIRRSNM